MGIFLIKRTSGGHYCDFLRFVDECQNLDFYILMDLADLARIRLLWLRARAYPKAIGDFLVVGKMKEQDI